MLSKFCLPKACSVLNKGKVETKLQMKLHLPRQMEVSS